MGTCLLSGFELCLEATDKRIQISSLDDGEQRRLVEWTYTKDTLDKIGDEQCKTWRSHWPTAEIKADKNRNRTITASVQAHRELIRPLIPIKKFERKNDSQLVYSGRLPGTLEDVLLGFGTQAKLEFYPLPLPPQIAGKEIDISLNKASVDEALRLIGNQAKLEFRREGKKVEIIFPSTVPR